MLQRQQNNRQRRTAFTLMEMLVVVAIIVALAGIGGFFFLGALEDAKVDTARTTIKGTLTPACEAYAIKHNGFPDSLQQLLVKDEMGGPYLKSADFLMDPWGHPYTYDKSGTKNNNMYPDISFTTPKGDTVGNWPKGR
jgi:general secretion pathway protein G